MQPLETSFPVQFSFQSRGPLTGPAASAESTGTSMEDCGRDVDGGNKVRRMKMGGRGGLALCHIFELVLIDTNTLVL